MKVREIEIIENIKIGTGNPLLFIAGPCVIESHEHVFFMAEKLKKIFADYNMPFIFKSSFDKANRSTVNSYRGPGIDEGLEILVEIKKKYDIPILTDVHEISHIEKVAEVADIIQIPAFLCRQTDLLIEAGKTGKPVNIKKGQFMAPWNMIGLINKVRATNNSNIMVTERGVSFGYNNLVVDFRAFPIMRATGFPVIFDATHSLQLPGGQGDTTGGMSEYIPQLVRSAIACGVDGVFMEIHDNPSKALCDGPNMLSLERLDKLLQQIKKIEEICDWR
ncbi:MAG: 3-deoxy-8-phosphooctulonate synthase [Candidatus Muirbacterium halophilum]|nr:3-deoxy-8-phosphooctulonate synthase [Candidatus Muirbacterium halophilum]